MSWTRRDFLRTSILAAVAGTVPTSAAAGASPFRALRRNVGIFTARGGPIGWLATRDGTLLVDSQFPDTAAQLLAALRERRTPPIVALVNTHHHGDHTGGNAVLRAATPTIVAHERVPALQRSTAEANPSAPPQAYADATFDAEWRLELGGETVVARHHGAAHTAGDAVVAFREAGVVHMGDLVFHGAYPFVDRAGGASIAGWIRALDAVAAEQGADTLFVFGHAGPGRDVVGDRADVLRQRDFLAEVLEEARRSIAAGRSRDELLAARESLPGFEDYAALSERLTLRSTLAAAFDELSG
jgi:cyclase